MSWQKVNAVQWNDALVVIPHTIFFHEDFLNIISLVYSASLNFMLYRKGDELLAATAFFSKENSVITPVEFYYHPYFLKEQLIEVTYLQIHEELLSYLKKNYSAIQLKLDVNLTDIRPFIWAGFRVDNKYTYIKNGDTEPHYGVLKKLRKQDAREYYLKVEAPNEQSIGLNIDFHSSGLGFSKNFCSEYRSLLQRWADAGYLKAFNVYRAQRHICSNLTLLDMNNKKAYQILLNNVSNEEKYAHTFLYQKVFEWCFENGFDTVDMCGANIQSISKFKSYYNGTLTPYFKVSYSPYQNKAYGIAQAAANKLFRIKNVFSFLRSKN